MAFWRVSASAKKVKRCLIRHRASRAYFRNGLWTHNPHQADDFSDLREIAEACVHYGLKEVDLIIRGDTEDQDVIVPLR